MVNVPSSVGQLTKRGLVPTTAESAEDAVAWPCALTARTVARTRLPAASGGRVSDSDALSGMTRQSPPSAAQCSHWTTPSPGSGEPSHVPSVVVTVFPVASSPARSIGGSYERGADATGD